MILRILNGKIVTASFSAKVTLRLDFIQEKIGTAVDTEALEKQAEAMRGQLKQVLGTKIRLERQMDTLDIGDPHYERKISDLQRRYDEQYVIAAEIEEEIDGVEKQIRCIRQEKISGDNIYRLLLAFDEVYHSATEVEGKEFMKAFIERVDLYPEKRKDGCWIKNIVFNFPIPIDGGEVKEFPLESESTVESIDKESDVTVHCDGRTYTVPAGTQVKLTPGESIHIQQYLLFRDVKAHDE